MATFQRQNCVLTLTFVSLGQQLSVKEGVGKILFPGKQDTFCQTSPPRPIRLGWPHTAWLSVIELDKAVVHVIRLVSFLRLWFQSVCPLMPSLSAYCLTGVSLAMDVSVHG